MKNDLTGIVLSIADISRFTGWSSDTIRGNERRGYLTRVAPEKEFTAQNVLDHALAAITDPLTRQQLIYWKRYLETGEPIPDAYYIPTEDERIQIVSLRRDSLTLSK
jgi:hypothetical protein